MNAAAVNTIALIIKWSYKYTAVLVLLKIIKIFLTFLKYLNI